MITADGLRYDYGKALSLSILFYDAQRTGKLPENNPIAWRGDSLTYEHGDYGEDLSGGWFDGEKIIEKIEKEIIIIAIIIITTLLNIVAHTAVYIKHEQLTFN